MGSFWLPWVALGHLLGPFWLVLEVPLGPRPSKDLQNGAPGTKMTRISIETRSKFFKKCTRVFLQSCSLQRLSQRETQTNSLNFVPELFFKVVPCNAFRKGNPKQILQNSYPNSSSKLFPAAPFAKGNPREIKNAWSVCSRAFRSLLIQVFRKACRVCRCVTGKHPQGFLGGRSPRRGEMGTS